MIWGIITGSVAGTTNFATLLTARIFLGLFEAYGNPALMLICSQYYTRSEAASRFQFWFMGYPVAQMLGALISYGFQNIEHAALSGWRIMYLALGTFTIMVGLGAVYIIPESPMKAGWLEEKEKVALLKHVRENNAGAHDKQKFDMAQLKELAADPQIYLLTLIICLVSIPHDRMKGRRSRELNFDMF